MNDAIDITLDVGAASAGVGTVAAWVFSLIHGLEAVVVGALVIWLMVLRIRSHIRRDRAEQQSGRQR